MEKIINFYVPKEKLLKLLFVYAYREHSSWVKISKIYNEKVQAEHWRCLLSNKILTTEGESSLVIELPNREMLNDMLDKLEIERER